MSAALFSTYYITNRLHGKAKGPVSDTKYNLLNTTCKITIYDMKQSKAQPLIDEAFSLCKDYENQLSKTIKGSDIYKINHSKGKPVLVAESTANLIQKGLYYGKLSQGRFDITVGKLSDLWDFTSENPKVPADKDIQAAIKTIDYTKVHIEKISTAKSDSNKKSGYKVWIDNPDSQIDLGGIAKGYIGDRVGDFLVDKGVKSAIINLGGNIVAIGEKSNGSAWNIGIEKPFTGRSEIVGSVKVKNKTVVTSGIYERMFRENGILYHHILNVKTGYPTDSDVEAVTIVGDFGKSVDCDALSTICLILGVNEGSELIKNLDGVKACFIDKNANIIATKGLEFISPK
ncbi:FAD:protein FMN transferase [Aminipila terrae]|uniref:FAD:protein FMN transferase n=1 Tax=Aminipila terrae TaxID=2697030 RepID=A0A6P1MGT2_9FIRM|nr:FAD:protein FMN transferase [Aminipila terrae]QHI72393.1 FAD:protein FMN transferase [Aminipila terrae]